MRWLGRPRLAKRARPRADAAYDHTMATLTARADLILEELDAVVQQMSGMLMENLEEEQ
jgi:hypothetical protein